MKTTKMSLANIQGKLSRTEMKNIMAGSGAGCGTGISCSGKKSGDSCGTKFCVCESHDGGLWCNVQM